MDVEPLIISGLERLIPLPAGERADWQDVLTAAGIRPRRTIKRTRLAVLVAALVATAAIIVATPVGATLGRGLDVFSTWLTGSPGKPSSQTEQRAFAQATRTWAGFPHGTQLRRLAQTNVGGATFTLDGFRGAGSLCLRLVVTGSATGRTLTCPPLSALRNSQQPALVVAANYGVGISQQTSVGPFPFASPRFVATFGVVADAVQRVELAHTDGTTTTAILNGDAFLAVERDAVPVTHAWAIAGGRRVALSLTAAPSLFGPPQTSGPQLPARGPAAVQRIVHGGSIGWFARREPRGGPVPSTVHHIVGVLPDVIFHREITPNPSAPERMVVSVRPAGNAYFGGRLRNKLQVCAEVVGGRFVGGGCWPAGRLFSTAPFSLGVAQQPGGQTVTISGLASDDVARLTLYLATGAHITVPLHDNGYIINVALADYPARLVAYDVDRRVIGIKTLRSRGQHASTGPQPVSNARWRSLIRSSVGEVFVARSSGGATCYAIRVGIVTSGPSCQSPPAATELQVGVGWNKRGAELTGRAGSAVARVVVHFRNGHTQTISPTRGYILAALPPVDAVGPNPNPVKSITALAADGRTLTQTSSHLSGGAGTISRITAGSITIGSGPALHHSCRLTRRSPSLNGYSSGMHVQYLCRDGALSLIGRSTPSKSATWATRTVWARGTITKLNASTISIQSTLARAATPATTTCALTKTSPGTNDYHLAETVQLFCSRGELTGIDQDSP